MTDDTIPFSNSPRWTPTVAGEGSGEEGREDEEGGAREREGERRVSSRGREGGE